MEREKTDGQRYIQRDRQIWEGNIQDDLALKV
jgi:hypothetical protein